MKLKNLTYAVLFMASSLFAQKAETPQYSYDMGGKISFMKLTDAGVLVVAGSGGLGGIKPGASQIHFLFKDYGKIKPEELDFIPMSPYVIINEGGMFSTKKAVIALKTLQLVRQPISKEQKVEDFGLTQREIELLTQLKNGLTYEEIASNLHISYHTVRKHIENIYRKLQVGNKLEAVKKASDNRIV